MSPLGPGNPISPGVPEIVENCYYIFSPISIKKQKLKLQRKFPLVHGRKSQGYTKDGIKGVTSSGIEEGIEGGISGIEGGIACGIEEGK